MHRLTLLSAVFGTMLWHGTGSAAELSVCVDKASASASMDRKLAAAVARDQNVGLTVREFDGSGDDDGFDAKNFKGLTADQCRLVLGFPIDPVGGEAPPGLIATLPYARIGFVLVTPRASPANRLSDLPKGTDVAVTYETMPNLYFARHPNVSPDIYPTDTETIEALAARKDKAAMVWRPTVVSYLIKHRNASAFTYHELDEPHAQWNLVALYAPGAESQATRFEESVARLKQSGSLDRILDPYAVPAANEMKHVSNERMMPFSSIKPVSASSSVPSGPPNLFTADQATAGKQKFADNCAQCHGDNLEGMAGPALKGPLFASVKAGYHVGDIFTIISQNMPSTQPGSLAHDDYVQIMAFILQQNGYQAGSKPLDFDSASKSKVPLLDHSN